MSRKMAHFDRRMASRKKRTMPPSQLLPPPTPAAPPPASSFPTSGLSGGGGCDGWRRHLVDRLPPLSQDVSVAERMVRWVPTPRLHIKSKWARKGRTAIDLHRQYTTLWLGSRSRSGDFNDECEGWMDCCLLIFYELIFVCRYSVYELRQDWDLSAITR